MSDGVNSLSDALRHHSAEFPEKLALIFLGDRGGEESRISYGKLEQLVLHFSRAISSEAKTGDRVLLAFPPGLEFVVAFLACLRSGLVAVPMVMPRKGKVREAIMNIVEDCEPSIGLTTSRDVDDLRSLFVDAFPSNTQRWLGIDIKDEIESQADVQSVIEDFDQSNALAFLQYTSGSTSAPKGVMVTHSNLIANLNMIKKAYGLDRDSTRVGWIPLHHDMGLIFNVLQSCYSGATCVLMAPMTFLRNPLNWLRAISKYKAVLGIGTNSAYQLCVDAIGIAKLENLDLSSWSLAVSGAEPIRMETLLEFEKKFRPYGFRLDSFSPGYGMAEATLVVSGGKRPDGPKVKIMQIDTNTGEAARDYSRIKKSVVGCGYAMPNTEVIVVEPDTRTQVSSGVIGEIWVRGSHVAVGYWGKVEATAGSLQARLNDNASRHRWLRTGDYGFLDETGEIFIAGRMKDTIIIRGENHYPQDIEYTAEKAAPALRKDYGAVFSIEKQGGEQIVVAYELNRTAMRGADLDSIRSDIRQAILIEHGLAVHECVLLRPGSVPKTTSGKIRRQKTRELWQRGLMMDIEILHV